MAPRDGQDPKDELVFTGERFIPHQTDPILALEHYHRYYFASRFVNQKKVLDCACGEGYGSAFLAKFAQSVLGIDIDVKAVEHARKTYAAIPNLSFEAGSCDTAPEQSDFDIAVSFELLEHLDPDTQDRFLANIQHTLKRDGLFLISSPEKIEYAETYPAKNEYHKHEMTLPEFLEFLGKYFKHVHLCAQRVLTLSTMWQPGNRQDAPFHFHVRNDLLEEIPKESSFSQPLYLVAICSNEPIPSTVFDESNSFYLDITSSDQTKGFSRWAQQLNKDVQEKRELIRELQQQLEESNGWAASLTSQINRQSESIESLQQDLESRTKWIRSMEKELEMRAAHICSLQNDLDNRTVWARSLEGDVATERAHANQANGELQRIRKETSASLLFRILAKLGIIPRI